MITTALVSYAGLCVAGLMELLLALCLPGTAALMTWPWPTVFRWPHGWWGGDPLTLWTAGALTVAIVARVMQGLLRRDLPGSRRRQYCALLCGILIPVAFQIAFVLLWCVDPWETQSLT